MKDGEREWPIENNGKKEWLDNTLPEPHPCTAGNKEEEHIIFAFVATGASLLKGKRRPAFR